MGVTIQYSHDTIRIAILESRYDSYRDTRVAIRFESRYLSRDTIRIAILESRYDSNRDT